MAIKKTRAVNATLATAVGHDEAAAKGPSLLARMTPKWLTDLPRSVTQNEAKLYYTRLAVPIMGGLCHMVLLLVYLYIDVPSMAYVNAVSIGIFAVAAVLVRLGWHYAGIILSILEAGIHTPLATFLLGPGAGYLIFNFIIAMCAALTFPAAQKRERGITLAYAFIASAIVIYVTYNKTPVIMLETWQLNTVFCLIATSTYFSLVGFAYHFVNASDAAERRIEHELKRSEALLLNILPAPIAAKLKTNPGTIADSFEQVTVLFADIVGFTKLSAVSPGAEIVEMLNDIFSTFDRIAAQHGLEKIKTIGDAYMVVGGLPTPRHDHAEAVVQMALDMVEAIKGAKAQARSKIEIRIGIHSGPVVAGVIGEQKFAYDLWGDTVNTASRMESHGLPGQIQISDQTADLVHDFFELESRGTIEVKGKGEIKTWWVKAAYPEVEHQPTRNIA